MQKRKYQLVNLSGGQTAVSYMPEIKGIAAVVDLATLIRITKQLRGASVEEIVLNFTERLRDEEPQTIERYTQLLGDELNFHLTCSKITTTDLSEVESVMSRVDELTDTEEELLKQHIQSGEIIA